MKRIISIVVSVVLMLSCVMVCCTALAKEADFSLDAIDFVKNFKAGWCLGNTLEATGRWGESWNDNYTVNDVETGWGNPTTTQAMFDKVAQQGFNAVRIPISWYRWTDDSNNYKIDDAFMARIKEVVGYAYSNNLYTIINMHHDDKDWLDIGASDDDWAGILEKYNAIWTQIANEFKDYDEYLIFEGSNELVNGGNWWGSDADLARVNDLHKNFVNTVRATGGNNKLRYLMLPTLGAQWYEHQWGSLKIPNNDKHCIIDIHWYDTDTSKYESYMSAIYKGLVAKGTPAVFGECGINKSKSDSTKATWAKSYFGTARKYEIPCFIWDDGGDFQVLNRKTNQWVSQDQVDAAIDGAENGPAATTAATTTAPTTRDPSIPTTTVDPSTLVKTVFYKFKPTNKGDTFKTEGWIASDSYWGPTCDLIADCQSDGGVVFSTTAGRVDYYSQTNTDWKNVPSVVDKTVFFEFTNNTSVTVKVKMHY
ncbi:MAG: glycoside hydrolase family 5 protein, partial [Acutalibacteraceae bacterium]